MLSIWTIFATFCCDWRMNMTKIVTLEYKYYFTCKVGDQDKSWHHLLHFMLLLMSFSRVTPWQEKIKAICCNYGLSWAETSSLSLLFLKDKCCWIFEKNEVKIVYPDCVPVLKPVSHDTEISMPFHLHATLLKVAVLMRINQIIMSTPTNYEPEFERVSFTY